jgi:hypothetical protein
MAMMLCPWKNSTMCGRYDNLIAREAYRSMFKAFRLPASNYPPRYNVAPTDQIPIVRIDPRDGERELVMARWGLVPLSAACALDVEVEHDGREPELGVVERHPSRFGFGADSQELWALRGARHDDGREEDYEIEQPNYYGG